jgi:hypothetical protein
MDPALQLHPGQQALTPAQEAEITRFAEAYIQTQLSTEPVNEPAAEALLQRIYATAGLAAPSSISWLDGPLQVVERLFSATDQGHPQISVWPALQEQLGGSMFESDAASLDAVGERIEALTLGRIEAEVRRSVGIPVITHLRDDIRRGVPDASLSGFWDQIKQFSAFVSWYDEDWDQPWHSDWEKVLGGYTDSGLFNVRSPRYMDGERYYLRDYIWSSARAYQDASWLASCWYFGRAYAPNDVQPLAEFNQLVSGYWLGQEVALIVRRPRLLSRDAQGRLHSESEKCLDYHDGWGLYAWHGVRVPEKVILSPETLTCDDFLSETNVETRRAIQERMGERFVSELGGVVLDSEARGTLYEVALPDDPERVARYVQVQDNSTSRQYLLRVPPTIQTAAEAVAWSFGLSVEEFHPAHET